MFLKDLFFPKFCLGCGMVGSYICLRCQKKLVYLEKDGCLYCQRPSLYGLTHPNCRKQNGADGFMALFYYNNLLKNIVKSFKYRRALAVWKELCLLIKPDRLMKIVFYSKLIRENNNPRLSMQPIPLYSKKQRERGFNQAKTISIFFQSFLNLPIVDQLTRVKETKPQAQIKQIKKRLTNIKDAFTVKRGKIIKNNSYIIIDDLLTTGNTAKEAATTLKMAGADKVFILTLAKG